MPFAHRSIQEFLTAWFISKYLAKNLPALLQPSIMENTLYDQMLTNAWFEQARFLHSVENNSVVGTHIPAYKDGNTRVP